MAVHWGGRGPGHVSRASAIGFSPLALFAASELGVFYDPSDLSTVWQDSVRTIPGAVGQPVGCIDDKSGNGVNATQTATASKPILRQDGARYYLEFDGADDFLTIAAINFTGLNKMTAFVGVRKLSDAVGFGLIVELSAVTAFSINPGSFGIFGPGTAGQPSYHLALAGATATPTVDLTTYTAPITNVITFSQDLAGASRATSIIPRVNAVTPTQSGGSNTATGGGNFGNYPIYIGRRGGTTLPWNGHIYGVIIRGAATAAADIASTEIWLNTKAGAF